MSLFAKEGVKHDEQGEGPGLGFPILTNSTREKQQVQVSCHIRGVNSASHGCTSIAGVAKEVEDGDEADEGE